MNTELKEKMQKAACDDSLPFYDTLEKYFMAGVEAMYAELYPLVEWVRVEDNPLPSDIEDFLIKLENGSIYRFAENWEEEMEKVTHWRKINL